jgi:sugar (pentulose or hexulose) kinase
MQILALDVGTSSVKAAVVDVAAGSALGPVVHVAHELRRPTADAAEIHADDLWSSVTKAAREACRDFPSVAGVGLSVLTPALVLLDKADKPLGSFWTHLDHRSRPAARQVWAAFGEEFLTTTGNRPLPGGISAVCYRQQLHDDPYLCHRVHSYLHVNGWLALRLTGERAFDPANASFTGLFGTITDQQWSKRWCDYFEVDADWLPPVLDGRTTVGTLRAAAAAELGVPGGVPLKLGTCDTSCAMLAAGLAPGDVLHSVGTTQVLAVLTNRPQPSPRKLTRRFGVGAAFVEVTHNPVGGAALEWMHQLCFQDQDAPTFFERTVPAAGKRSTRVLLDPPFLGGDRLEIEAHRAALRDLTLAADRMDLLTAVLQAMVRHHGEALRTLGIEAGRRRTVLTGGGAAAVQPLLPDYAGAGVEMLPDASLRGAARLFDAPGA